MAGLLPSSTTMQKPRAIIIGGGPVGLTAALGLARADIDFLLLESRHSVVINAGSDMTLLPPTMPMLDQLDLLEPLRAVSNRVDQIDRIDHSGRGMGALHIGELLTDSTGYYPTVISRYDMLRTLYEALPYEAKNRILVNQKVREIRTTSDGVRVTCTNGEEYDGTFIIGADGAYSRVRESMRTLALEAGAQDVNGADPFVTSFQAMWIRFPTSAIPDCRPGMAIETHGSGIATQLFAGKDTATVGIYRRLGEKTRRTVRYKDGDQDRLVQEWKDLPMIQGGNVCLQDVYDARLDSGLVNLEEGVLARWSWDGRMVLVGDAAHKFTPSRGSGMNTGIMDVVVLMNEIHTLMSKHTSTEKPNAWWDRSALAEAFERYQEKRIDEVTAGCQESGNATAMATWENTTVKLLDQYVIPSRAVQWLLGVATALKQRSAKPVTFNFG